jgi:hypothetical protein
VEVTSVNKLIPVLQTAIGPMILISAIGLLLLTMTNRLGRAIDRARTLAGQLPQAQDASRHAIKGQLRILWKRARLIRIAIAFASTSALAAACLIIVIFVTAVWQLETAWLIGGIFVVCMVFLILSLLVFLNDINRSLGALRLELDLGGISEP